MRNLERGGKLFFSGRGTCLRAMRLNERQERPNSAQMTINGPCGARIALIFPTLHFIINAPCAECPPSALRRIGNRAVTDTRRHADANRFKSCWLSEILAPLAPIHRNFLAPKPWLPMLPQFFPTQWLQSG